MRYVLGVDGGGSKVICLLANEKGELLGYGEGGPVNTNYVLYQEAIDSLTHAINTALHEGGVPATKIDVTVMSVPINPSALETTMNKLQIKNVVKAAEGETPRWAARFWINQRVGVTVDAGTGSLSRGWSEDGRECGAGGFGVTMGDEGSGLWIGMKAIISAFQAFDGRLDETRLSQAVLDYYGVPNIQALLLREPGGFISRAKMIEAVTAGEQMEFVIDSGVVLEKPTTGGGTGGNLSENSSLGGLFFQKVQTREPLTRFDVASLCKVVVQVAREGDPIAIRILEKAGVELGRLANAVIKRLHMEKESFAIVIYGGVVNAGDLVLKSFSRTCLKVAPKATIVVPRYEPEVGAVLIALHEISVEIDKNIIHAIETSSIKFQCK